jgi:hypothetical protein
MNRTILFVGALLAAASLFSQTRPAADPQIRDGKIVWFQSADTMDDVRRMLGNPAAIADFGQDLQSWQYQIDNADSHEFSHQLVFRKSDRKLMSVTRNYEPERNVDILFPTGETTVHHYPDSEHPQFSLRLRRLPGGLVLVATGTSAPKQSTTQILLIRQSYLSTIYPWVR